MEAGERLSARDRWIGRLCCRAAWLCSGQMTSFHAPVRDTFPLRLAVLTIVALVARAATFGSPLVHVDEPFYLTVAQGLAHGVLPYVDLWDRKPIGLFLVYLPAAVWGLPASLYVYQAMAAAAVVATALLVARLADAAGWRAGALPAGIFYILWLNLGDGQGGQSPVFYNLLTAGAALLVAQGDERRRRARGVAAMLLIGVALQIKYSVLFEGIGLGLWLMAEEWRRRRRPLATLGLGALLCLVALLPTGAALATYAVLGHLDAFVYANFLSILHRGKDAVALQINSAGDAAAILSPLLLAVAGWRGGDADPGRRRARIFMRLWLLVAVLAFIGFGGWYNHYTLPVMLPGAVMAAAMFRRWAGSGRWAWLWAALPLALLFVAGQMILRSERARRGTPAQFAALVRAVGHPSRQDRGGLFVYSGPVLLYPASGRPALTRYIFPSHLQFYREAGSIGVDQRTEIERIFARRPAVVVLAPAIDDEAPAIRDLVKRLLWRGGYRVSAPLRLGRDQVLVFRRAATT